MNANHATPREIISLVESGGVPTTRQLRSASRQLGYSIRHADARADVRALLAERDTEYSITVKFDAPVRIRLSGAYQERTSIDTMETIVGRGYETTIIAIEISEYDIEIIASGYDPIINTALDASIVSILDPQEAIDPEAIALEAMNRHGL